MCQATSKDIGTGGLEPQGTKPVIEAALHSSMPRSIITSTRIAAASDSAAAAPSQTTSVSVMAQVVLVEERENHTPTAAMKHPCTSSTESKAPYSFHVMAS